MLGIAYRHCTEAATPEKARQSFSAVLLKACKLHTSARAYACLHTESKAVNRLPLPKRNASEAALQSNAIRMMLQTAGAGNLLAERADTVHAIIAHIQPRSRLNLI